MLFIISITFFYTSQPVRLKFSPFSSILLFLELLDVPISNCKSMHFILIRMYLNCSNHVRFVRFTQKYHFSLLK